jgi:hypothetical protein
MKNAARSIVRGGGESREGKDCPVGAVRYDSGEEPDYDNESSASEGKGRPEATS